MKPLHYLTALASSTLIISALAHNAIAASIITYTQDTSDFTILTLPSSSTNPAPAATSGTVYVGTLTGSVANQYRSPFENATSAGGGTDTGVGNGGYGITGWDKLAYSSVQAGASATYDFASTNTLSILWGSPNSYNTLTFMNGKNVVGSITGTSESGSVSGIGIGILTYGHDQMTFTDTGGTFDSVVLSSTTNAFEFADLTVGSGAFTPFTPTPLPGALPLFATGFGALGLFGWRRKRKAAAIAI